MTEAEWLACTDPELMLDCLRGKVCDRKLTLLSCHVCRRLWHLLPDEGCKRAVEAAERSLDGKVSADALQEMRDDAWDSVCRIEGSGGAGSVPSLAAHAAFYATCQPPVAEYALQCGQRVASSASAEMAAQAALVRDLFGNPFRPVAPNPAWLIRNVRQLAQAICETKDFDQLPILADALEDAGCHDDAILAHCRRAGEHVRGCWVVDLILGKK
jgi:hypothetical protein